MGPLICRWVSRQWPNFAVIFAIFITNVVPADKAGFTVDDDYFSMIVEIVSFSAGEEFLDTFALLA